MCRARGEIKAAITDDLSGREEAQQGGQIALIGSGREWQVDSVSWGSGGVLSNTDDLV